MEIEELSVYLKEGNLHKKAKEQLYWPNVWNMYIEETTSVYNCLTTKEALVRMISEVNFKNRSQASSCEELGVWIRVGDICYIDFGINYINEAGFQHFGVILAIRNNKVLVVPMTSNVKAYRDAQGNDGKGHLMAIGKIEGMHRESTLFLNDSKFINSARIIDVKAHISTNSELFKKIKQRFHEMIG
ncbi:hypothetical protein M2475_001354 [Breznakia sp. PF5-3]|uniref:hypothetical protein n=1 Tax=unclassified Breznakia TaxID=2623764 RepID=UPI002407096E|nr:MULTISPECIES: hypothetical protein [unclassified Breznakia]MDF9824952.1 hypothetical protein [Breznakia sp. PM6-1]MDF9835780.1 hypothetical protein [Breznakia sp. PF5-3]MDF9837926.1 hypothetical protein [Breznakia sp. PFB2-8]MDF9859915.1 hypothetical protein [Breznakia sp. PH5-24]